MANEDVSIKFGAETSKFNAAISGIDEKIDSFFSQLDKSSGQMTAFANRLDQISGKFSSGKSGVAEYASQVEKLGKSFGLEDFTKKSGEGFANLSLETVGAKREIMVLGHEMISGNFSRVPGSLMVLAERMGGLSMATMGAGAALGLAAYGAYEWFDASQKAEQQTNLLNVQLNAFNSSYLTDEIKKVAEEFGKLPKISEDSAMKVATGFAAMNGAGGKSLTELMTLTRNYAAVMSQGDIEKGFLAISKAMENPLRGAKDLSEAFHGQLSQSLINSAIDLANNGDKLGAQAKLIDALNERLNNAADNGLTNFQKKLNSLWDMLQQDWSMKNVASAMTGGFSDIVEPKPEKKKTEGQKQDEAEVKAEIDAQNRYNQEMERANDLARSVKTEESQRADLVKKIAYFTEEANKAKGHGDDSSFKNLSQAAEAYQEKLNKIDEAKARMAERDQREAERAARAAAQAQDIEIQGVQRVENEKLRTSEEMVRLMVASKQMGYEEEYTALKAIREQEFTEDQASLEKRKALWKEGSEEWNRITGEMTIRYEKYQQDLMKLDEKRIRDAETLNEKNKKEQEKAAKEAAKPWDKAFGTIEKSLDSMLEGVLRGTQTTGEAFRRLAGNLVLSMIEASAKGALEWIKGEAMKTAATLSGDAARTSSNTAAAAAAEATGKAAASSQIGVDAAESAANVYSSVSSIPYVGWILAPPAAAAAFTAVMAYNSFDVGTNYVPNDMTAQIHEGERIIPKADNAKLMKAVETGSGNGGAVHLHVNAVDAKSVQSFFKKNRKTLGKQLRTYARTSGKV